MRRFWAQNYPFCYKIKETLGTQGSSVIDDVFCALLSNRTLFNSSITCDNSLVNVVELAFGVLWIKYDVVFSVSRSAVICSESLEEPVTTVYNFYFFVGDI